MGLLGRDPAGLRLLRNLIVAFVPAAAVGLLLDHWIDEHLFFVRVVVAAQISGAVLMFAAERWRKRRTSPARAALLPADLPSRRALGIGLMQCLALWPGMSRSMTTIVGGYFAGFEPPQAAEFSFLLGFVTLTAATVYKGYQSGAAMIAVFGWAHCAAGHRRGNRSRGGGREVPGQLPHPARADRIRLVSAGRGGRDDRDLFCVGSGSPRGHPGREGVLRGRRAPITRSAI